MGQIKFGFGQLAKPTPQLATNIFRVVLYGAAIVAIVTGAISEIPDSIKVVVMKYSAEATVLVHALSKLFGVDVGSDPTMPKNPPDPTSK